MPLCLRRDGGESYYKRVSKLLDLMEAIQVPTPSREIARCYYKHPPTEGQWFRVAGMLDYLYFSDSICVFSDESGEGYFYRHKIYGDTFEDFLLREVSPH